MAWMFHLLHRDDVDKLLDVAPAVTSVLNHYPFGLTSIYRKLPSWIQRCINAALREEISPTVLKKTVVDNYGDLCNS